MTSLRTSIIMLDTFWPTVREMAEQGLREGTVAAGAVEGDIVGLRRKSDQKAGRVADARQSFGMRGSRRVLQRIGAAGVEKDQMDAVALSCALRTSSKCTVCL